MHRMPRCRHSPARRSRSATQPRRSSRSSAVDAGSRGCAPDRASGEPPQEYAMGLEPRRHRARQRCVNTASDVWHCDGDETARRRNRLARFARSLPFEVSGDCIDRDERPPGPLPSCGLATCSPLRIARRSPAQQALLRCGHSRPAERRACVRSRRNPHAASVGVGVTDAKSQQLRSYPRKFSALAT